MSLAETISTVTAICADFLALYRTRLFRTDHEAVIIYHYIKRIFDEGTLPDHLKHEVKVKKHRMESRRIAITNDSLQKVMDGVEDKYNNYTLCSDWFEREEDEEEELVRTLVRSRLCPRILKRCSSIRVSIKCGRQKLPGLMILSVTAIRSLWTG